MEQTAIVKRILSADVAEISLMRQLECGLSCKSCEGCPQKPNEEVLALADNALGAEVGAVVTACPSGSGAKWAAGLLFLLPCVGLIFGYLLTQWFGGNQGVCILGAFVGLGIGFVPAILINRAALKQDKPEFTIVSLRR